MCVCVCVCVADDLAISFGADLIPEISVRGKILGLWVLVSSLNLGSFG